MDTKIVTMLHFSLQEEFGNTNRKGTMVKICNKKWFTS